MTLIRSLLGALALALTFAGASPALAQSDAQPGQLSPPPVIVSPSPPVPSVAPNSVPGSLSGLAPNAAPATPATPAAPAATAAPAAAPAPELERLLQTLEN